MKRVAALAAALLAAPLIFLFWRTAASPPTDVAVHSDLALIELATLQATRFEQLDGPYSRFKVHHPGPALFYWLAPFYAVGGHRFTALCLGILVLNLLAVATLLLAVWRLGGEFGVVLAAPLLGLVLLHGGPALLWSVWNPEAGIFPLAAGLACAVAVAAGRLGFLPTGLFFGSFAAQCHVLYLVPVLAAFTAAAAFVLLRPAIRQRALAAAVAGAAVLLLLWAPVLDAERQNEPGNLALLLRVRSDTAVKSWGRFGLVAGAAALGEAAWAPFGYKGGHRLEGSAADRAAALAAAGLVAGLAALTVAGKRRSPLAAPVTACGAAFLAGSAFTLASASGEFHVYLTRFLVPIGPLLAALAGCALASVAVPFRRLAARATVAAALGATALVATASGREIARALPLDEFLERTWGPGAFGKATPLILAGLERQGIKAPYIGLLDSGYWPYAAAIALQVEKRGGHALVHEDWLFMFGKRHLEGAHDGLLLLQSLENPPASPSSATVEEAPVRATFLPLPAPFGGGRTCLGAGDADFDLFQYTGFYDAEFSPGEPASRWSRFDQSRLSVRLLPGRAYRLDIEALPYAATLPQKVEVRLNGHPVADLALEPDWRVYSLDLPAGLVRPVNEISLSYARSVSPIQISGSHDSRWLAVRFRAFCFVDSPALDSIAARR